jgi:hypothetical protein
VAGDVPDQLTLEHHRDLRGREKRPIVRWTILTAIAIFVLLGLVNVFGQRPSSETVSTPGASIKVYSPLRLRSGLYYESRFTIEAREEIRKATVVLEPGWLEGITVNTIEPGPVGEASRDGSLALELGHIPKGDRYLLFLQSQVNPTNVGRRSQDVELRDGERLLARIDRTVTIFP